MLVAAAHNSTESPASTSSDFSHRTNFNQTLSTLNCLHEEAGGRPLRPTTHWKYKQWKSSSSSSSTWWQWSESWWSSQEFNAKQQKKSTIEWDNLFFTDLWRKNEWLSRVRSICYRERSFTADGGGVKTTPQKTRFRDVKYARIWDAD